MAISVHEDESEAGGFAFIDLGQRVAPPIVSLRRLDTEPRHLGFGGWQPEIAWLAPLSVENREGGTIARFGPQVVDCIEELVPIEIVSRDGAILGTVVWPFITPAPTGRSMLVVDAPPPPVVQTTREAPPPLPAEVVPPAPPVPQPVPPPPSIVAAETTVPPPPPVAHSVPLVVGPAVRRKGGSWLLALAILAVVGGLGVWKREPIEAWVRSLPVLARTSLPVAPASSSSPSVAQPTPEAATAQPSRSDLLQQHARLLRDRAAAAAFVDLGTSALSARQGAIAFRAFEEADPAASADAAWQLARFYDPRNTEPSYREAVEPNPTRAAYYYALWRNRSVRHTEELRALCAASSELLGRDERLRTLCQP